MRAGGVAGVVTPPAHRLEDVRGFPIDRGAHHAAWLDAHLDRFDPWVDGRVAPDALQRFGELAIAYDAVAAIPFAASYAARWREFLAQRVTESRYAELARSRLEWAHALLLPYLVLRRRGLIDRYNDATLAYSHAAGFPSALEVVPYRALDYAYFSHRSQLGHVDADRVHALVADTFAAQAHCACVINEDSAYAITHAIFYASEFGQSRCEVASLQPAAALVDSLIVDAVIRGHYDLLGELLICSAVLPGTNALLRHLGLPAFYAGCDDEGAVLPNATVTERSFEACYHTTLVALLLCAAYLHPTSS